VLATVGRQAPQLAQGVFHCDHETTLAPPRRTVKALADVGILRGALGSS
jgi:hypothetical protein